MKPARRYIGVAAAVGLAATMTACSSTQHVGGGSGSGNGTAPASGTIKPGGTVTISNEQGQTWSCNFNPFNTSQQLESLGTVYEPLVYQDIMYNQAQTRMLASSYTWN